MKVRSILLVLFCCFGLFAKEVSPETFQLYITTDPSGANLYIEGKFYGVTPFYIRVYPGVTYNIKVTKEFYKTKEGRYTIRGKAGEEGDINIVLKKKKEEKDYDKGFSICYSVLRINRELDEHIAKINNIAAEAELFNEILSSGNVFPKIKLFEGIEICNMYRTEYGFLKVRFSLYRNDMIDWASGLIKNKANKGYSIEMWSPQVALLARMQPVGVLFFYPYVDVGVGYNLFFMTAYKDNKALGGVTYASTGLFYGAGIEFRFFKFIGVTAGWERRDMCMEFSGLWEMYEEVTNNFIEKGLDFMKLPGDNLSVSLNLYW